MNTTTSSHFPTFGKAARATLGFMQAIPGKCLAVLRWLRRFLFSKTSFKCYLIIATLICLTYTTLRWIGRRAWQAENERAAAAGMATDRQAFTVPMPPDKDNFLAADIFQGLTDRSNDHEKLKMWFSKTKYIKPREKRVNRSSDVPKPKQDTLAKWCEYFRLTGMLPAQSAHSSPAAEILADQRWQPAIQALYTVAARPTSRFHDLKNREIDNIPVLQIDPRVLFSLQKSVLLYAEAHLEMGNSEQAIPAFQVTRHLVEAHAAEAGHIPLLRLLALIRAENTLLQTGMRLHRWPASVLKELLATNYPERLQQITRRAIQYERVLYCSHFENFPDSFYGSGSDWLKNYPYRTFFLRHLVPDYLPMRAAVRASQHYTRLHESAAPLARNESWPARMRTLADVPGLHLGPIAIFGNRAHDRGPMWEFENFYETPIIQVSIRHLAIAMELHYLIHAKYPLSLDQLDPSLALSPQFTKDLDGQPLRYAVDAAGSHFTIYSEGMSGVGNLTGDIVFSTDPGRLQGK